MWVPWDPIRVGQPAVSGLAGNVGGAFAYTCAPSVSSRSPFQGIPTHDADGTKIGEGRRKKMRKMYQQQEKLYAEYVNAST